MASGRSHLAAAGVVVATALLFGLGTGLHPTPLLTWLAPLPALVLATRTRARSAATVAFLGYALSTADLVRYQIGSLEVPAPVVAGLVLATSLVFAATVLVFHGLVRRGRRLLAWLAPAAVWASVEFLVGAFTPYGSNWSLANSQLGWSTVTGVAGWAGCYALSFVIVATGTGIALATTPGCGLRDRWVPAALAATLLAGTLAVGLTASREAGDGQVRVAAVAARRGDQQPFANTPAGRRLVAADLAWVGAIDDPDLKLVVFPESDLQVTDSSYRDLVRGFAAAARRKQVTVVLGIARLGRTAQYNQALTFNPDGGAPVVYDKQYPIAGQEAEVTPGRTIGHLPGFGRRAAVAICADLAHPVLGREYADAGARLLAVPALDFGVDDEMTSRVQLMRGVESGFAIVRAARDGFVTIADEHGRVLAEKRTGGPSAYVAVSADLRYGTGPTFYARHGDWFGWGCVALALLGVAGGLPPRRRAKSPA